MKSNTICQVILAGSIILASCQSNNSAKQDESQQTMNETVMNKVTDCKISAGNITFTNAINGAENCVKLLDDGALEFHCAEGLDFFSDPNGKLSNTTLPILLVPVENTKPFTLIAKVTPEFTAEGLYNAADLFVYSCDSLWQKLAFEQDEYGNHRIVTVRTQGTSDDNNHDKLDVSSVYLKISSDTKTIASYYSIDKKRWNHGSSYTRIIIQRTFIWVSVASVLKKAAAQVVLKKFLCPTIMLAISAWENKPLYIEGVILKMA